MTIKDYLKKRKIKVLQLSRDSGLGISRLSLFLNSWIELRDAELKAISRCLNVTEKELKQNEIKE